VMTYRFRFSLQCRVSFRCQMSQICHLKSHGYHKSLLDLIVQSLLRPLISIFRARMTINRNNKTTTARLTSILSILSLNLYETYALDKIDIFPHIPSKYITQNSPCTYALTVNPYFSLKSKSPNAIKFPKIMQ